MALPTLFGEVEIAAHEGAALGVVCAAVATELACLKAKGLTVHAKRITFRGGIFRFVTSLNLLIPVTHGLVEIAQEGSKLRITYRITFEELLVASGTLALAMTAAIVATGGPFWIGFFFAVWLILGNVLTVRVRFPRFLRRVAASALRRS